MTNGIVNIHGKDYMTVAKRVELAHEDKTFEKLTTEVLSHNPVVIKAVVTIKGREFSGISAVLNENSKMIEKTNPYEVAETSAVGRALGFAGYGIIEGIASADEMVKSGAVEKPRTLNGDMCPVCGKPATTKSGEKNGKPWSGLFCSTGDRTHTQWLHIKKEVKPVEGDTLDLREPEITDEDHQKIDDSLNF